MGTGRSDARISIAHGAGNIHILLEFSPEHSPFTHDVICCGVERVGSHVVFSDVMVCATRRLAHLEPFHCDQTATDYGKNRPLPWITVLSGNPLVFSWKKHNPLETTTLGDFWIHIIFFRVGRSLVARFSGLFYPTPSRQVNWALADIRISDIPSATPSSTG